MLKTINVGVIGLGVGMIHAETIYKNPTCKLVAVCDRDKKKLDLAKKKFRGIKFFENSDEIFKNKSIKMVIIASYDNFHADHILKAIKNKKHFFVEKPFCLNFKEFKKINKTLQINKNIKFSSNLILRNSPHFHKIKKTLNLKYNNNIYYIEGEYNYGRIYKLLDGWRGKIPFYSVTLGGGIHILDLILNIVNDKVIKVNAVGNNLNTKKSRFKYNDCVTAIIVFKSGLHVKLLSNFSTVENHNHYLKIFCKNINLQYNKNMTKTYTKNKVSLFNKKYSNKQKSLILNSFINSLVKKNKKPLITQTQILNLMNISLFIEKSLETKKWQKIIN